MLEKIIDYLKRKDWTFTYGKVPNVLFFPINGFNATFNCIVDINEDNSSFLFITFNGTTCPQDKRIKLAELLTRLNNNLRYGNFEMGMESGEIKFRTSLNFEAIELNDKIIDNIILKNIYIHDFSFPFLSKFLFGNMTMDEVYNNLYPSPPLENKQEVPLIEE
jgi:hypothetical protein